MELKSWEYAMTSAMRVAMKQNKFDALNLYLKLEKASKKYLESGEMEEGDTFKTPLENGGFLIQSFYQEYSTLSILRPDKRVSPVINKADSVHQEYRQLIGYTEGLEDSNLGIGARFPEQFKQAMMEVKPGQVLVFDNGRSYVCEKNEALSLQLVQTSDTVKIPHISEFQHSERVTVNLANDISIQNFYAQVRDDYNDDVRFRVSTTYKAQETLNRLTAGLDKQARVLQIGPNRITVKKPFLSKGLSFYDENHQRISEESVKILLGWLDVATVVTEFARSNPATPKQEFDDNMVRADIDALFDAKHFNIAGFIIGEYCQENGQDLSINFSSYVDGQAISFVFKYEKNDVQLYKISYESNDFSSEPTKIEKSSFKEFESFCEKKYNETFVRIKNDVRNEILKDYPQYHGENLEKVLDRLTAKKIAAEHLMTPEISNIREDIGSLLDSIGRETDGMELE